MVERKNIPCERFVNEYKKNGDREHFVCREGQLCRECSSKTSKETKK